MWVCLEYTKATNTMNGKKEPIEDKEMLVSHFVHNILTLAMSIFLAYLVFKSGILELVLTQTTEVELIGAFVAGIFFTSLISSAPAIIALGTIATATHEPLWMIAVIGGAGALIGDLILFSFLKTHISDEIYRFSRHPSNKRLSKIMHLRSIRWLLGFVGAIIIASPLPDELGLALMGVGKMRLWLLSLLSFVFNSIGIYVIGIVARNL